MACGSVHLARAMVRRTLALLAVFVSFGSTVSHGAWSNTGATASPASSPGLPGAQQTFSRPLFSLAQIQTVFVIVMENHDWASISGNPSAPYINNQLLPTASHAEQYYGPPGLHPSLPNYLWLEAGTNFGVWNDSGPFTNGQSTSQHLVTELTNAGKTWKAYEEDIDGQTCPLNDMARYVAEHDPFVFFGDVTNGFDSSSQNCIAHIRPYVELARDLQNNVVANYNFITPDLCDDMHDCDVSAGDNWLSTEIPKIMNSAAYQNGGAIFVLWDENQNDNAPIGMIVLSPFAKGNGYWNTIRYTHSSTLLTLEEIFGLPVRLGDTASATDLSDLFAIGSQGPVQLIARHSGKCLDVPASSTAPVQLDQWPCFGGQNQQWNLIATGDGSYAITSILSGMSLDVSGLSTVDGAPVGQYPYWGGPNEKWYLQPAGAGYFQVTAQHSGKCLDVAGGATATGDGTPVDQWSCWGGTNQEWEILPAH